MKQRNNNNNKTKEQKRDRRIYLANTLLHNFIKWSDTL